MTAAVVIAALLEAVPAPAGEVPDAAPEMPHRLRVHLSSPDDGVELRRIAEGRDLVLCKTPCDSVISFHASDQFVLDGPALLRSAPFRLPGRDGDAAFRVSPGYVAARATGLPLLLGGSGTFAVAGLVWFANAKLLVGFCDADKNCIAANERRQETARVIELVGLGAAIVGGALVILGGRPTRIAPVSSDDAR